jgi:hypothetical protein
MGYRINYVKNAQKIGILSQGTIHKNGKWKYIVIVCGLLLAALLNQRLRYIFLPGNPQVTERAIFEFAADIKKGESFSEAITAFCREILDNA